MPPDVLDDEEVGCCQRHMVCEVCDEDGAARAAAVGVVGEVAGVWVVDEVIVGIERGMADGEVGGVEITGGEMRVDGILELDRVGVAGDMGKVGDDVAVGSTCGRVEHERVVALGAGQRVVAAEPVEDVGAGVADDDVGNRIAGAVDRVGSLAVGLDGVVAGVVDPLGVVAGWRRWQVRAKEYCRRRPDHFCWCHPLLRR